MKKSIVFLMVIVVILAVQLIKNVTGPGIIKEAGDLAAGEEGKVNTVTEAALEEAVRISRLYTAEYPYNGYTAVYDGDHKEIKYYVAYEGTVRAGIDVDKINVSLEEAHDTILILLPEIEVFSSTIDAGAMEYIFTDDKYNTETVAQEAYKAANSDLMTRASEDSNIITTARESAKIAAKALVEPWINQVGGEGEYTVRVLAYEEGYDD